MIISGNFETREVLINGKLLDPGPSQKVWNHSPNGFLWGYESSGPAQLALAILLLVTDKETAVLCHQEFKRQVIAKLPRRDFSIDISMTFWIDKLKAESV